MTTTSVNNLEKIDYITEEDVKYILSSCGLTNNYITIDNYVVNNASNKMLGFLSDYWRLKVVITSNSKKEVLSFFIKAVSRSNAAKASMVKELKLFEKELAIYTIVKKALDIPGLKPWSAGLITALNDAMVFQDLNAMQYKLRNKFQRFDTAHTFQALRTLSRFHASSIIFETKRNKELQRSFIINDEFGHYLDRGAYNSSDQWYQQCMKGSLEAIKAYSKYNTNSEAMKEIERRWADIWNTAWQLCESSPKHTNVICHRDLWNNNILFHYKAVGDSFEPDDCMLVDFQAVTSQPPAGDVMLLLYCNLEPKFREVNMKIFLDFYYAQLKTVLNDHGVHINEVLPKEEFLATTEEQRLWGLVVCACLMPQFWIDDEVTTKIFCDAVQFEEILSKDKASFIKRMMQENEDYKINVMNIFNEIVERYCIEK